MSQDYELFDDWGYTSKIYRLPGDPPKVCKLFNKDCIETHFPVERQAYERFASANAPSSILRYYGTHDQLPAGLILELAENRNIDRYLWDRKYNSPGPQLELSSICQWAWQAAEALEFAHALGVYNADIHTVNFFLDHDLNLKVGDWAGASIDGSKSHSSYRLKSRLFDADGTDVPRATGITPATEVFALGTALYYMVTCQQPWPELEDPDDRVEIIRLIKEKKFPDTEDLPVLGKVIMNCWHVRYSSMTEVKLAIDAERALHAPDGL